MYFIIIITIFALKLFFAKNFIKKIYVVRVVEFFFKKAYNNWHFKDREGFSICVLRLLLQNLRWGSIIGNCKKTFIKRKNLIVTKKQKNGGSIFIPISTFWIIMMRQDNTKKFLQKKS